MDIDLLFKLLLATVVLCGAVIKTWQLWRDPDDLPLRALAPGLICLTIATTIGIRVWRDPLDEATGGLVTVLVNYSIMGAACSLVLFFLWSVHGHHATPAIRREFGILSIAMAVVLFAWLSGDAYERMHPVSSETSGRWNTTLFICAVLVYLLYCWVVGFAHAYRYWRMTTRTRTRSALVLVGAGMALMTVFSISGIVKAGLRFELGPRDPLVRALGETYTTSKGLGQALIVGGLCLAGLLAKLEGLPTWRRQLDAQRRLFPLWQRACDTFPAFALSHRPVLPWLNVRRNYYRSIIEIRDALVELGPYYPREPAAGGDGAARGGATATVTLTSSAQLVAAGFRAYASGATPHDGPHPRPGPTDTSAALEDDAAWLVALSDELARQGFYREPLR